MRATKISVLFLALALVATGCFKVNADIKVTDDGSGSVRFLTAVDSEAFDSALGGLDLPEGAAPGDICEEIADDLLTSEVPAGSELSEYDQDGFCGAELNYELPAGSDHSAVMTQLLESDTELSKRGENWIFSHLVNASELNDISADAPPILSEQLYENSEIIYVVELPGSAIEGKNNADRIEGGRFEWDIDLLAPPTSLFAQTQPGASGDGSGNGLLIGLIVAGLLLAAMAGWFLFNRRGRGETTAAAAPPPPHQQRVAETLPVAGPPIARTDIAGPPVATAPVAARATSTHPTPAHATEIRPIETQPTHDVSPTDANQPDNSAASAFSTAATANPMATPAASAQAEPSTSAAAADTPAVATPTPVWDPALKAWIVDHPTHGRLRHDTESNTWKRIV